MNFSKIAWWVKIAPSSYERSTFHELMTGTLEEEEEEDEL
jgi:hypothetical protein